MQSLKLTIEWIPRTSGGKSLNKLLPNPKWKKIREQVYAEHDQRCAVCGVSRKGRRLDCHEVWEYDDEAGVQRLKGFVALCYLCHRAKHGIWLHPPREGEAKGSSITRVLEYERRYRKEMAEEYQKELALPQDKRDLKRLKTLKQVAARKSVLEHFLEVNGCRPAIGEQHILEAIEEWRRRSQHEWKIDFGGLL